MAGAIAFRDRVRMALFDDVFVTNQGCRREAERSVNIDEMRGYVGARVHGHNWSYDPLKGDDQEYWLCVRVEAPVRARQKISLTRSLPWLVRRRSPRLICLLLICKLHLACYVSLVLPDDVRTRPADSG